LAFLWLATAQTEAGSESPGTVLAVSPVALDFGLVGVGRTKELSLTVQNMGGEVFNGKAIVEAPFSIAGETYSLRSGQSQSLKVRYQPTAPGTNRQVLICTGDKPITVSVTGSAGIPPQPPGKPRINQKSAKRFAEVETSDFIVRYYSNPTSYILKPSMTEGAFRSICDRALVLKIAREQPKHELAVVVLNLYPLPADEEAVKLGWVSDLEQLGYHRIVFLRGRNSVDVKGLPIVDGPNPSVLSAVK